MAGNNRWEVSWESQELHNHGETKRFTREIEAASEEEAGEEFYNSCKRRMTISGKIMVDDHEYRDAIYIEIIPKGRN